MPDTVEINPLAVYTADQLSAMLDVSDTTLAEARRTGALRSTKKGRRVLYLGEWVLGWLRDDSDREVAESAAAGGSDGGPRRAG
jgi:Helix-turn-helix domain